MPGICRADDVHRQISQGDETIDYAFMGQNSDAADNRWLREAFESRIPIIYFLGIVPGRYQAMLPAFVAGWDATALKAQVAFGMPERASLAPPENVLERRYALRAVQQQVEPLRNRTPKLVESSATVESSAWRESEPDLGVELAGVLGEVSGGLASPLGRRHSGSPVERQP